MYISVLHLRQFLFFTFLSFAIAGFAQSPSSEIDSLYHLIPSQEGLEKFNSYFVLANLLDDAFDIRGVAISNEAYTHFLSLENPDEKTWRNAGRFPYIQARLAMSIDNNYKEVQKRTGEMLDHAAKMEAHGFKAATIKCNAQFYRSIIYYQQYNNELALETALKAVSYFENPDTVLYAMPVFAFIGGRLGEANKFATAKRYFDIPIKYYSSIIDGEIDIPEMNPPRDKAYFSTSLARLYYNRSQMYVDHELYEQALPDLEQASVVVKNSNSTYWKTQIFVGLNRIYIENGRSKEAFDKLKPYKATVDSLKNWNVKNSYYLAITKAAENIGNYKAAYEYFSTYNKFHTTFIKETSDKELTELQTKYETKEKENEIVQLQATNESRKNQNSLLWFLVGGLSLLAGFIYFQSKQKKNFAAQILKKDTEVLELKENFFINITHQLRTPLSLIIAPLKEVQSSNIDAKSKLKIDQALNNSGRLLELFNQLLDWNKMEAHALELSMQKANIVDSIQSIFNRYEALADQKQINFIHEVPAEPVYGEMDFDKFEKVLSNLISNAIKFTPVNGKVTVRSKISQNKLRIEVEDNGIGIKESDIEKVFEKYYQAGDGSNGFGFGLTFANELTKLMGGNLSAQSTSNVKTIFELAIPFTRLKELPATSLGSNNAIQHNPIFSESSLSLLVVEDNIELNNYLCSFFESQYTILSALNKKEALEFTYEYAPDIILCDVMLPDGTGFQILEELKNNASTNHIPILMLTAKTDDKDRKEGWDKGADGYLSKPFDPNELNAVIHNLLVNRKKVQEKFKDLSDEFLADKTPVVQDPFMENLLTLMNDNIGNEYYSIDDLAANFPINRTHFYQKVKAVSGSTPKTLFRELRLKKANHLIKSGVAPKEAALKTGFVSLSHFSRSYKSFFKENPSETSKI